MGLIKIRKVNQVQVRYRVDWFKVLRLIGVFSYFALAYLLYSGRL